ncbi:Na+/H+ antiporter subunit D [Breoghania sp.]|uniref:Na+/H+ antiporter subunit D n=1 Tax=Breoghania sp. TaxID=2065378 RepID=UPI002AA7A11E|nr:Na+/H+ antiporter subunit D [Breoghania sp.]
MAVIDHSADVSHAMVTTAVPLGDWLVVAPTIITILGGVVCLLTRKKTHIQPRIAIATLALLVLSNFSLLGRVMDQGVINMVMGQWLPPYGIAFTVDPTGAMLALIASVVAFATALYGVGDSDAISRRYGFYPFLMLLMTGVSGTFLTGDIFNMYVWFEVLLISSFGLLILGNDKAQLDGAVKYGILNLIATTLFLIATGYLYGLVGTLNMADIRGAVENLPDKAPILTVSVLYLLAFAMKAAAFPVNFWLPASYHTPRIAVAGVFAGLLTKVGVYALLRTMVMLLPAYREMLSDVLAVMAVLTMITGALGGIAHSDLRRALGYLVISGIGSMLAGITIASQLALTGTILYAIHSIIVMTGLYFVVGMASRMSHTFQLRELGGLYAKSPLLALSYFILAVSLCGLPPTSGFWAKVVLVDAAIHDGWPWLAGAILFTGFLTCIAVARIGLFAFWRGGPEGTPDGTARAVTASGEAYQPDVSAAYTAMWLALGLLTGLSLFIGLAPNHIVEIAEAGASGLLDPVNYIGAVFGTTGGPL